MNIIWLAFRSFNSRKLTTFLTALTLALSVSLYLMVGRVKSSSEKSFLNTVSKVDLIVGAKGGSLELLLYSVFHLGSATNNIAYQSFEKYQKHPQVEALIPISLGDSHKGYRVVGTDQNFFQYYRFQGDKNLSYNQGGQFNKPLELVLGSEVAKSLQYMIGQEIHLSHGVDEAGIISHDEFTFKIVGILNPTHTPIDRSVYVPLLGLEVIHADWQEGYKKERSGELDFSTLKISSLTSFMVIAKNRIATLFLRQSIVTDPDFDLMAIIPGIELSNMWQALSYLEKTMNGISGLVIVIGFLSMMIVLFHSLESRRREMAIYRTLGASPVTILTLLILESGFLTLIGSLLGILLTNSLTLIARPLIYQQFGLYLNIPSISQEELLFLLSFVSLGTMIGIIPALKGYKNTLRDGLMVKL
ncbi:MAG: ABC transporter permease [Bacteriovoracaceae bacterium]